MFEMGRFEILAELSVALLGFSGLMVAFGYSRFSEAGFAARIRALVYTTSAALIASLLPLLNLYLPIAAALLLAMFVAYLIWVCKVWLFGGKKVRTGTALVWFFLLASVPVIAWLVISLLNQGASLGAAYQTGIGYFLLISIYNFGSFVLYSVPVAGAQADAD
jgi:hypothetical protein